MTRTSCAVRYWSARRASLFACWLLALLSLALDVGAAPSGGYDATIRAAVGEFGQGNWQEARALFQKAHELSPSARTLRGLGMAEFELRNYVESANYLQAALESSVQPLTPQLKSEVEALLARARGFFAVYRVTLEPHDALLRVDGAPPRQTADGSLVLGLGRRTLEVSREARVTERRELDVVGGETGELRFELAKQEASRDSGARAAPVPGDGPKRRSRPPREQAAPPSRLPAWLLLGAGGALVAGGLVVGALALDAERDFRDDCPKGSPSCDPALESGQQKADRLALAADVLWISGAAAAAGGLGWLVLAPGRDAARTSAQLGVTPSGGTLSVRGAF